MDAIKAVKRPVGRPRKAPSDLQSARLELRLTRAEKSKLMALGGAKWVRSQLAKAKNAATMPPHASA